MNDYGYAQEREYIYDDYQYRDTYYDYGAEDQYTRDGHYDRYGEPESRYPEDSRYQQDPRRTEDYSGRDEQKDYRSKDKFTSKRGGKYRRDDRDDRREERPDRLDDGRDDWSERHGERYDRREDKSDYRKERRDDRPDQRDDREVRKNKDDKEWKSKRPCNNWTQSGDCKFGNKCNFSHEGPRGSRDETYKKGVKRDRSPRARKTYGADTLDETPYFDFTEKRGEDLTQGDDNAEKKYDDFGEEEFKWDAEEEYLDDKPDEGSYASASTGANSTPRQYEGDQVSRKHYASGPATESVKSPCTVMMVAEKPSIALSITEALCGNNFQKRTGPAKAIPIYTFKGHFKGHAANFKVTSVAGHVFNRDFPIEFQDRRKDPVLLFNAPTVKACEGRSRPVAKHL